MPFSRPIETEPRGEAAHWAGLLDKNESWIHLAETLVLFSSDVFRSREPADVMTAVAHLVRGMTKKSLINQALMGVLRTRFHELFLETEEQGFEEFIKAGRKMLDKYDMFTNSHFALKVHKFLMHALTLSFFDAFDFQLSKVGYDKVERELLKRQYKDCNFLYVALDTLVFLMEKGHQIYKTGETSSLLHNETTYSKWNETVIQIKEEHQMYAYKDTDVSNDFLAKLEEALSIGEEIVQYVRNMMPEQARFARASLSELRMIHAQVHSISAARQQRGVPFPLLIFGESGQAKTLFSNTCISAFATAHGENDSDDHIYTLNPATKFWNGYARHMWCLIIDDLAFKHPNLAGTGEDSLMEIIQIINNVAYMPDQAAIENKGKIPCLAKLVVATTNTKHLNAHAFFSYPIAMLRRLPYIVNIKVKPEYATDGMLDAAKILDEECPNHWNIVVEKVVPKPDQPHLGMYKELGRFTEMSDFLRWFKRTTLEWVSRQNQALTSHRHLKQLKFCDCGAPEYKCKLACGHCTLEDCMCAASEEEKQEDTVEQVLQDPVLALLTARETDLYTKCGLEPYSTAEPRIDVPEAVLLRAPAMKERYDAVLDASFHSPPARTRWARIKQHLTGTVPTPHISSCTQPDVMAVQALYAKDAWATGVRSVTHPVAKACSTAYLWCMMHVVLHFWNGVCCGVVRGLLWTQWPWAFHFARVIMCFPVIFGWMGISYASLGVAHLGLVGSMMRRQLSTPKFLAYTATSGVIMLVLWRSIQLMQATRKWGEEIEPVAEEAAREPSESVVNADDGAVDAAEIDNQPTEQQVFVDNGKVPEPDATKRPDVWKKDDYITTSFELSTAIMSCAGSNADMLREKVRQATVRLEFRKDEYRSCCVGVAIGGQLFLANNHCIPSGPGWSVRVISMVESEQINSNFTAPISEHDVVRHPTSDFGVVRIRHAPPRASLVKFFARSTLRGNFNGMVTVRKDDGGLVTRRVIKLTWKPAYNILKNGDLCTVEEPMWWGQADGDFSAGDCGSPYLAEVGEFVCLVGIHRRGNDGVTVCAAEPVGRDELEALLNRFTIGTVQGGGPMLCGHPEPGPLHTKSPVRYMREGFMRVFGSWPCGVRGKSHVRRTIMAEELEKRGFVQRHDKPVLRGWEPKHVVLSELAIERTNIDLDRLDMCVKAFLADIEREVPQEEWQHVHVLDNDTTMNGAKGVAFVDRMNRSTSAGWPRNKSKKHFVIPDEQSWNSDGVKPSPEIQREIDFILHEYSEGRCVGPVFSMVFKDEPRSYSKIKANNTRVFTMGPMSFIYVMRKYLLGVTRIMCRNPYAFETAKGVVAQSEQWAQIGDYLTWGHTNNNLIAGDFRFYDKSTQSVLVLAAFEVFIGVARRAGYSEQDLRILQCIGFDLAFHYVESFGDLIQLMLSNPSGNTMTTEINNVIQSLLFRYVWSILGLCLALYRFHVRAVGFGDDGVSGVKGEPRFNHTRIADELAKIGFTYTMADKTSESRPYIGFDEITFLKRRWSWSEELETWLAPLDMESIEKMLMVTTESRAISHEAQCVAIVSSAVREMFMYGRTEFEQFSKMLLDVLVVCGLTAYIEESTFPTYDALVAKYWENSSHIIDANSRARKAVTLLIDAQLLVVEQGLESTTCVGASLKTCQGVPQNLFSQEQRQAAQETKPKGEHRSACLNGHGRPNNQHDEQNLLIFASEMNVVEQVLASFRGIEETAPLPDCPCGNPWHIPTEVDGVLICMQEQSDAVMPISESSDSVQTTQVTTGFTDQTRGMVVDYSAMQDEVLLGDYQENAELQHWLSRPQLISTTTWNESDTPGTRYTINPWYAFMNAGTTRKKLDNYAFINATLVVEFRINASPFYFGSQLVSYQPMAGYYTPNVQAINGSNAWMVSFSQMPHMWIYPQTSQGGTLKLPFFYHKNWLPLTASDTQNMGKLTVAVVNQLMSANGVTGTGVTVQTWAWMEDVKLLGPTINLAIQGRQRKVKDEYLEGPVEHTASGVAEVASALSNVPIIGPFARATEIGAGLLADVASLFGWSNPPQMTPVNPVVPRPFPYFAATSIPHVAEKLTLDPKQELSIDPRIAGLPADDELLIKNLVTRESYLTSCTIATTAAVDAVVFNAIVSPNFFDYNYDGTTFMVYPTPLDHFSRLFQYWRGDIEFRFRFICTQYHKGRVRITYDPVGAIVANVPDYTSIFNQVVDIGVTSDVTVRVPYMQAYGWLKTRTQTNPTTWNNGSGVNTAVDTTKDNGTIAVRVVTPITAPILTSQVTMQVFVRAADNFELAAPVDLPDATYTTIQGDINYADTTTLIAGGSPGGSSDCTFALNMGERVVSLRTLLRRTTFSYSSFVPADTTDAIANNYQYQTNYPPWYGYDANGRHSAKGLYHPANDYGFNYVRTTPFHWIARAFVGLRGSMIWQFNVDGMDAPIASMRVFRNQNSITTGNYNITYGTAPGSANALAAGARVVSGASGAALTNQRTNTGLQVCVPDYNLARFHWCDPSMGSLGNSADGSDVQNFALELRFAPTQVTKPLSSVRVDKYFSAGPDLTFLYFLCAPSWTQLASPTPT